MKNDEIKSECCEAAIRYLDCEDCRKTGKTCIYVCTECGEEVKVKRILWNAKTEIKSTHGNPEDARTS